MASDRFPSVKTLTTQLNDVDVRTAKLMRKIVKTDCRADLEQLIEKEVPQAWSRILRCYSPASNTRMKLEALDILLDTCGIERLYLGGESGREVCSGADLGDRWLCTYLNAGDTYAPTIMLVADRKRGGGNWRVGCWGDLPEVNA